MSLPSTILQSPEATAFMTSFLCSNCLLDNSQISWKAEEVSITADGCLLEWSSSYFEAQSLNTSILAQSGLPLPQGNCLNVIWDNGMGQPCSHKLLYYSTGDTVV